MVETEIEEPNAAAIGGTWLNPQNVYLVNINNCTIASLGSFGSNNSAVDLEEFALTDAISITKVEVRAKGTDVNGITGVNMRMSKDGFSTECVGNHGVRNGSWGTINTCGSSGWSNWQECTHSAFGSSLTVAQARSNDLGVRFLASADSEGGTARIDQIQVRISFELSSPPPAPPKATIASRTTGGVISRTTSTDANGHGGGTPNNVQHQISTSSTFASGNLTWTKGSATSTTQTHDWSKSHPTHEIQEDTLYYCRARLSTTEDGYGDWSPGSPYNSATSHDIPSIAGTPTKTTQTTTSISIAWTAPSDNGGISIAKYLYGYRVPQGNPPRWDDLEVWAKFEGNFTDSSSNSRSLASNSQVDVTPVPLIHKDRGHAEFWNLLTNKSYVLIPSWAWNGDCLGFAAWVKTPGARNESLLGDSGQSSTLGFIWSYLTSTSFNVQYANGSSPTIANFGDIISGFANTWVHIAFTIDYTNKQIKAYRNGTQFGSTHNMSGTPVIPRTLNRYIGEYSAGHSYDWEGYMSNWMLWGGTDVLTLAQIAEIYDRRYTIVDTASTSLSATQGSLSAGTQYEFYVYGNQAVGDGELSALGTFYTLCATPTISSVVAGASKLTINWSTVTGVDEWDLERSPNGSSGWATVEAGIAGGTLTKVDTIPRAGETWYYRLRAINPDADNSSWSANVSGVATGLSIFKPSTLRVIIRYETFIPTSMRVVLGQQIFTPTNLKIRALGQQKSLPSSLIVSLTSQISLSSILRVLVFTASFTPEVTFSRYELNDVTSGTIDDNLDFGLWEGIKTLNAVAVDPYEDTMVNPDKHEFYYTVSPRSGTENFFQNPVSDGLINSSGVAENGYRAIGFEQQTWSSGTTELISLIDTDGDWAGSGSQISFITSLNNTSTGWSPPSASGTNVFDVPRPYNGTMMVVVQPTDWDGDTDHKLHDWLPFQVSVGHAVEVSEITFISGTHQDSLVEAKCNLNIDYDISFKVYHEMAKEWEWYSGATMIDNGTITPVKNTWKFINNVVLGQHPSSGTYTHELRLYTDSGSVLHPNPVRVVTVDMII